MEMIKRGSTIQFGDTVYDVLRDFNPEQVEQERIRLAMALPMSDFLFYENIIVKQRSADFVYTARTGFTYRR